MQRLRYGDDAPASTMPTIGHDLEIFEHEDAEITLYDVGGQKQLRAQWERYIAPGDLWGGASDAVSGVVFVVDSADTARLSEAREELHKLINEPRLQGTPMLVLANKMDLRGATSIDELATVLGVRADQLPMGARCAVRGACSLRGEGVVAALEWVSAAAVEAKKE